MLKTECDFCHRLLTEGGFYYQDKHRSNRVCCHNQDCWEKANRELDEAEVAMEEYARGARDGK
jgi:hypothetical protein